MADPAPTTTTLTPIQVSTQPKPGWKTTEFWLKLLALLLTAFYSTGIIPTIGPIAAVAAIAATMLGALGYAVVRSNVKAAHALAAARVQLGELAPSNDNATTAPVQKQAQAGFIAPRLMLPLAILALAGVGAVAIVTSGCGAKTKAAETAYIDCLEESVREKVPELLPTVLSILSSGVSDWQQQLEALAKYAGKDALACAVQIATGELKSKVGGPDGAAAGDARNRGVGFIRDHGYMFKPSPQSSLETPSSPATDFISGTLSIHDQGLQFAVDRTGGTAVELARVPLCHDRALVPAVGCGRDHLLRYDGCRWGCYDVMGHEDGSPK